MAAIIQDHWQPPYIHDAARESDVEALRRLLAAGVDPNQSAVVNDYSGESDPWRCTPLHAACAEDFAWSQSLDDGHAACVAALLEAGADPNAVDNRGKNALLLAAFSGRCRLGLMLVAAGATVDPNYKALIYGADEERQRQAAARLGISVRKSQTWEIRLVEKRTSLGISRFDGLSYRAFPS